jgi:hypothetical protein
MCVKVKTFLLCKVLVIYNPTLHSLNCWPADIVPPLMLNSANGMNAHCATRNFKLGVAAIGAIWAATDVAGVN